LGMKSEAAIHLLGHWMRVPGFGLAGRVWDEIRSAIDDKDARGERLAPRTDTERCRDFALLQFSIQISAKRCGGQHWNCLHDWNLGILLRTLVFTAFTTMLTACRIWLLFLPGRSCPSASIVVSRFGSSPTLQPNRLVQMLIF
jgi:hypothetical protein